MKKLFFANVDVWNCDAGSILVGANSLEDANELLCTHEFQDDNITYIGRLQELQTPYAFDGAFEVIGDTEGLFCAPGEDWVSVQFHKECCEQNTHFASIDTFLDREMPFFLVA